MRICKAAPADRGAGPLGSGLRTLNAALSSTSTGTFHHRKIPGLGIIPHAASLSPERLGRALSWELERNKLRFGSIASVLVIERCSMQDFGDAGITLRKVCLELE